MAEAVGDGSVEAGDGCRRVEFYGGEVAAACPQTGVDHIDVFMNGGDDLVPAGSTL
jgi:hypothetical protein